MVDFTAETVRDLRPRRLHETAIVVDVGAPDPDFVVTARLPTGPCEVDFSGTSVPPHMDERLLSHFPAAHAGALMLDLGCGSGVHRGVGERAGYEYVGVDYSDPKADYLADAHRLPFDDDVFDFVLSVAVFEHLRWPLVAVSEVARVLRPGGTFLGTVSFAEPFHQRSYYHHTHLAMGNNLLHAGFEIEQLAADPSWTALRMFAKNALFPRMPMRMRLAMVLPVIALHRAWWSLGRLFASSWSETRRLTLTTGNWSFVARKPDSAGGRTTGQRPPTFTSHRE